MPTIPARLASVLLSVVVVLAAPPAAAALSEADWRNPGDGLLTLDTATGLEWLDVTVTQNLSWNTVTSQLAPAGPFAGFRRATNAEVTTFWRDAGIPDLSDPWPPITANYAPAKALQQLWGHTGEMASGEPGGIYTIATTAESFNPVSGNVEGVAFLVVLENEGSARAYVRALLGRGPNEAFPYVTHALVRGRDAVAPIPESSTIVLLLSGLATTACVRLVRRRGIASGSDRSSQPPGASPCATSDALAWGNATMSPSLRAARRRAMQSQSTKAGPREPVPALQLRAR